MISGRDAAKVYLTLWDGMSKRKIPCDEQRFSEIHKEVCDCVKGNVDYVCEKVEEWLDYQKKLYICRICGADWSQNQYSCGCPCCEEDSYGNY